MEALQIIGAVTALIGSIFLFLGALGILRMPDLYNRIQAGTKATTLGTILTLGGLGIYQLEWLGQMGILILFIAMTNPLSSHALARAAHYSDQPLWRDTVRDELADGDAKASCKRRLLVRADIDAEVQS